MGGECKGARLWLLGGLGARRSWVTNNEFADLKIEIRNGTFQFMALHDDPK